MPEPSDTLRQIAARGRRVHANMMENLESQKSISGNVSTGVDILDFFFDLSGSKRRATRLGKAVARDSALKRQRQLERESETWASQVRDHLSQISELRRGLTRKGNSSHLTRGFMRSQQFVKPTTKLAHGITFLEALSERRLVWNEDIPDILIEPRRQKEKELDKTDARRFTAPAIVDENSLTTLLSGHPSELEAVLGAFAVYKARTPDSGRQALSSCRNAIENLVKKLSGEANWSRGLEKLVPSETRRRTVRQAYSFLSAYGTHGIASPSNADVELGMRMTVAIVQSLLEWEVQLTE